VAERENIRGNVRREEGAILIQISHLVRASWSLVRVYYAITRTDSVRPDREKYTPMRVQLLSQLQTESQCHY